MLKDARKLHLIKPCNETVYYYAYVYVCGRYEWWSVAANFNQLVSLHQ
jgi:hypothetical protein